MDVTAQRSTAQLPFGNNVDGQNSTAPLGQRTVENVNDRQITLDTKFEWRTQPRSWLRSGLTVGTQGFFSRTIDVASQAQNFPGPGLEVLSAGSPVYNREAFLSNVNGGVFAQEQLEFSNWVFGTLGGHCDYSSAFGEQAPGVFYRVGPRREQPARPRAVRAERRVHCFAADEHRAAARAWA